MITMSDDVKVNEEIRMKAVDETNVDPASILVTIVGHCPCCGERLHWAVEN